MEVRVVSADPLLAEMCRSVLETLPATFNEVRVVVDEVGARAGADLYLWDFESCSLPADWNWDGSHNIFVVELKNVEALREKIGARNAAIVLKPAFARNLRPFLELAVNEHRSGNGSRNAEDDRSLLLQCLLEANLKLQAYEHSRTNFLARAVHDFRAPLTALNGYCGLLIEQQLGSLNGGQIDLLQRMHQSVKRLTRMSTALFELSAGRNMKYEPDVQRASVETSVGQAVHEVTPLAVGKQISISVCLDAGAQTLMFDPGRIEQVLINLLENACRFTPRNGAVEISGYAVFWENRASGETPQGISEGAGGMYVPNAYRLDVRNTGIGIPPECAESIFEEHSSHDGTRDRSGGGFGLAICRLIVEAHCGRIWAESVPNGACLSFVLPYRPERTGVRMSPDSLVPVRLAHEAIA